MEQPFLRIVVHLVNKFAAFYGTRHWSPILSLTNSVAFLYHLCLGLSSGLFPSGFPIKNCIWTSQQDDWSEHERIAIALSVKWLATGWNSTVFVTVYLQSGSGAHSWHRETFPHRWRGRSVKLISHLHSVVLPVFGQPSTTPGDTCTLASMPRTAILTFRQRSPHEK
jgi:hypothetical protein